MGKVIKRDIPLGIDLGTTYTCGAVWWNERVDVVANDLGNRTTPSYYYYDGIKTFVGETAKSKIASNNHKNVYYDSKRLLAQTSKSAIVKDFKPQWTFGIKGIIRKNNLCEYIVTDNSETLPPVTVSSGLLKAIKEAAEKRHDCEFKKAVITVPAYFSLEQKRATHQAAKLAGLEVLRMLSEPVAAAIAYGVEHNYKQNEKLFVFDLGGGTFDVTIMVISNSNKFEVKAVDGNSHLGGRDFDRLIVDWMTKKLVADIGKEAFEKLNQKKKFRMLETAQKAKEDFTLSEATPVVLCDIHDQAKDVILTRSEFEAMSTHLLQALQDKCLATLKTANLKSKDIDHVLFVGGSSRLVMVETMLKKIFDPSKFSKIANPDEVVAMGAVMMAASLIPGASSKEEIKRLKIIEVLPHNIGVEITGGRFKAILPQNSAIPCEKTYSLVTSEDNQRAAVIPIYEGVSEKIAEDRYIADITIYDLPIGKAGSVEAQVTLKWMLGESLKL